MSKNQNFESRFEKRVAEFETRVDAGASRFESAVINWVKNDRVFDGFRNTYARILLASLTWAVLYGLGAYVYVYRTAVIWYAVALLLANVAQRLSVRFVFSTDDTEWLDEYQEARRNLAYRRAYRRVWQILLAAGLASIAYLYAQHIASLNGSAIFAGELVNVDLYRATVLFIALAGLFTLQPYLSWGFRGEPFRSKHEPND